MKSERFSKKGINRQKPDFSEVAITHYRGPDELSGDSCSLQASYIFDLHAPTCSFENDGDVFAWLCAMAGESPTARIMMKDVQEAGWVIRMLDAAGDGFALDTESCVIMLDHFGFTAGALGKSVHLRSMLFLNFVKALREIWHANGGTDFDSTHRPDALLMLERARAADLETISLLTGWELRGAGHADIWRYLLGSEQGDMAMVFTRAIEKDPAGFYDGSVIARTFCQWYDDDVRMAACDHAMLEQMDEWLEEAMGTQVFGNEPLRAADVEKLSRLPGGGSYLSGMGRNICTDPYFMALEDPINESHLFQIVYDSKVVFAGGVPFRDQRLASLIFPGALVETSK